MVMIVIGHYVYGGDHTHDGEFYDDRYPLMVVILMALITTSTSVPPFSPVQRRSVLERVRPARRLLRPGHYAASCL